MVLYGWCKEPYWKHWQVRESFGKWMTFIRRFSILSTTPSALKYMSTFKNKWQGLPYNVPTCSSGVIQTHTHTHTQTHTPMTQLLFQFGVQYLAQRHFSIQKGGAGDQTTNVLQNGRPTQPSEQQPPTTGKTTLPWRHKLASSMRVAAFRGNIW